MKKKVLHFSVGSTKDNEVCGLGFFPLPALQLRPFKGGVSCAACAPACAGIDPWRDLGQSEGTLTNQRGVWPIAKASRHGDGAR
jgi:hypothetical protein